MITADKIDEILAALKHDPDKEDNWSPLVEVLREPGTIEDIDTVIERIDAGIAYFEKYADWDFVARLLRHRLDASRTDDEKADLGKKLARLYDSEIFEAKKAKEAYEEVLRLRPGDEEANTALNQLKATRKKWRDVVEQYTREANDSDQATFKSGLYLQAAGLYQMFGGKTKDKFKDVLHYLQLSLEADPANRSASGFLKRILVEEKQWEDLVALYFRLSDVARTKEDRVDALVQRARILATRMERPDEAAEIYAQVLELSPGNQAAMAYLVDYYTSAGLSDHLVALYEDILRTRPKGDDELATLLQIAMVHWRMRNEMDKAESYFRRIKRIQPSHPAALNFYRSVYTEAGDWGKLVQTLNEAVRGAKDNEARNALYREIADVAQNRMNNVERAIDAYKAISKLEPENRQANEALKDLYRSSQKWNALLDALKKDISDAQGDVDAQVKLLFEVVGIYRDHLNLDPMVIKTYHQILDLDPGNETAIEALGAIYEGSKRWNDLIAILEKRVDLSIDPAVKVRILERITAIWTEQLSNFNKAVEPLEAILSLQPDNRPVMAQLEQIYEQKRSWEPLLDLLEKELEYVAEADRLDHYSRMASLAGEKLGRHDKAIDLFWKVLSLSPGDQAAMATMEKLCERQKRYEDLARVLELKLEHSPEDGARVPLLMKLGTVYSEQLEADDKAIDVWKRLLAIQPNHPKALRILKETYIKAGDWDSLIGMFVESESWEGLADVLNSTSEGVEKDEDRVWLSFKAAQVYRDRLGNQPRAVRCWERVLSVEPGNREAALALLPVYESEANWARFAQIQGVLLDTALDDRERIERLKSMVDVQGEKLRDQSTAFKAATRAFELSPTDPDVAAALSLYGESLGAWSELVAIYRKRLESAPGEEALALRHEVADILMSRLGNLDEALEEYKAIQVRHPGDPRAYDRIEQILTTTNKLGELIEFYEGKLGSIEEASDRISYLMRMARIAQEGMDDVQKAASYFEKVLGEDPESAEAMGELESIYRITERWEDLVGILERRRDLSEGDDLTEVVLERGKVLAEHLGRLGEAVDDFAFVLEHRAADREAVEALERHLGDADGKLRIAGLLEPHLAGLEKYSQLTAVKKILLDSAQDPQRRMQLMLSLAGVYSDDLQDLDSGYHVLGAALAEFPDDETIWDRIEAQAQRVERNDDLKAKWHALFSGDALGDDARRALARRLGRLCEERLGEPDEAEQYHRWIFENDPLDDGSFAALEALYTGNDRYEEVRALYRERVVHLADAARKSELLQKIGFIEEDVLEKAEDAIETYREVLTLEPGSEVSQKALERLYEACERWNDLAELLEAHIDEVGAEGIVAARFRLGDILDRRLGERARALAYYRLVLAQYPTHLKSQEALERMIEDGDLRQEVASILSGLYETQGAFPELARILAVRLEGAGSDLERVELLVKLSEIQEKRLKDSDAAYESLSRAFELDPGNEEVRQALELVVEAGDLWSIYAEELEEVASRIRDAQVLGPILFDLGNIFITRLSEDDKALSTFNRYLGCGHDEPSMVLGATRALESIYALGENHGELTRVLSIQLGYLDTDEKKVQVLRRIGEIQEVHLEATDDAIRTYLEILDIVPGDMESIFCLERLYDRAGAWEDLIGILRRRIEAETDAREILSIHFMVAGIFRDRLEDLDEAIFTYLTILEKEVNREALEALVELYDRTGADSELVDTLGRLREIVTDPPEQAALLFRMGEVERARTRDLRTAVERYSEVLRIDPAHQEARAALEGMTQEADVRLDIARILAPLFDSEQNYPRLLDMIDIEIGEEQEPAARDGLLRRAAEVAEIGMSDPGRAFGYYARALKQVTDHPGSASVVDDLERIVGESGDFSALVDLYSQVAPAVYEPGLQLKLYSRIAQLNLGQLGNLKAARDFYVKVLDISPQSMEAVTALERIYWQTEAWSDLLEVLKRKTDLIGDPIEKVSQLFRQAEICEEKLSDPAMAIEVYEEVLEMEENRDAVHALERLYEKTERWGNLRDIVERQLDWPGVDEVELHHRLGMILSQQLGDPQEALAHFREALRLDPKHEPTVQILESWLDDSAFREQVAELLEPIYLTAMRFDRVQAIILVRLEFVSDPQSRKELFQRSGEIYEEQLEDLDKAFDVYARMFAEDPENIDARANLDRLGNVLDAWPRVAETYQGTLDERLSEDETTLSIARHLGMIYDNYVGNADGAVAAYRRALSIQPSDQEAFGSLEALFMREERWEDLFGLYRDVADGQNDMEVRRNVLYQMGQLCEEKLDDRARAIDIFREVMDIQHDDPVAIGALERLYYYEKRFHDLSDLLHMRIDQAGNAAEQLELKYRLATVYDEHLSDREAAIALCEEILSQDSSYRDAVAALENMLADEDHRLRVAQILIPIYKECDDWRNLSSAYRAELEFLTDTVDRIERLREIAQLAELRGKDASMAMDAWSEALLEDPSDGEVVGNLQRLAEAQGRWADLVAVLEKALERTEMSTVRASLMRLAARVMDRQMGEFAGAVAMYKRLLDEEEGDIEALEALDALYTLLSDWEGLISALDMKAEYVMDAQQLKVIRRRQGEVCEDQLGSGERAIGHYVQAMEADPADMSTMESLERLYEQAGKWEDLDQILRQKLSGVTAPDRRREVLVKIATVQKEKLENFDEAINAYHSVLEDFPADTEILEVLDGLYAHEERHDDRYMNLERRAEVASDTSEVIEIYLSMGQLLTDFMADTERAIDVYRRVLEMGDNEKAFAALEAIAEAEDHRWAVIAILEPIYRRSGSWDKLLRISKLGLEIMSDPAERVSKLMQIAELYERGTGDASSAFESLLVAFKEEIWHEELYDRALVMADQLNRFADFAGALEEKAQAVYDAHVLAELNTRLGQIWEEKLGNVDAAIAAYRRILDHGADERTALDCLDRLYFQKEAWEDLVEIIVKKREASTDIEEQNVLSLRLGEIRYHKFEDVQGAVRAYASVLDTTPDSADAMAYLEEILDRQQAMQEIIEILSPAYRASGNLRKLVHLLDIKAAIMDTPEDRVMVLREEAHVAENELTDPEAAFQAYGKALWEMPEDHDIMMELERLAELLNGWAPLSQHVATIIEQKEPGDEIRKDMTLKLATWSSRHLQDPEASMRWYAAYLELDPENVEAMRDYEKVLDAMARDTDLLDVLERRQALEYDFEAKKEALRRIADVATCRVGDMDRAAKAYEELVHMDETDLASVDALIDIRAQREDSDGLIDLLHIRISGTHDAVEANANRHRLAKLYADVKKDDEQALEIYREVLLSDPADEAASAALERLYESTGKWFDLKEHVISRMDATSDPALRVHALKRLADLAQHRFDDKDEAVSYLQEAYNLDPLDGDVLGALEHLLASTGRLDDLIHLFEMRAAEASSTDPATELALLVKIGEIYTKELDDTARAVEYYERVLEREPNHSLALSALARLHEQAGDWERCIQVLDLAANHAEDTHVMGDIFYRIGVIKRDRMDDLVGALESFNAVLEVYPEHAEILTTLKDYFAREKDWGRYVSILEVQERLTSDPEAKLAVLLELASIMSDRLMSPEQALGYLEQANSLKPGDLAVLGSLVDSYIRAGRTSDAIPMLEDLIKAEQQAGGPRSKQLAVYYHQLGQAYRRQGDATRALEALEGANRIDMTNFAVNFTLGELYMEQGRSDDAMRMLRPLLLQNLASTGIDKADVYFYLGKLHIEKGEKTKAQSMLDRGLAQNREHQGIKDLLARLKS